MDDVQFESTGVELLAFGFVEDVHVSSNTCKDMQAHASLSKGLAGSLLDGMTADSEVGHWGRPLLSVRQVAKLLGVCSATVYRLCARAELPHFRVLNAIRIDSRTVKRFLTRSLRRGLPARPKALYQ